ACRATENTLRVAGVECMPHHPEQNVLRKVFILFVCFNKLHTERVSRKEEALAFEGSHSSSIAQKLTRGQSQPGRSRCGVQIADESGHLCLDPPFRLRGQLFPRPEFVRPLGQVVKSHRAVVSIESECTSLAEQSAAKVVISRPVFTVRRRYGHLT